MELINLCLSANDEAHFRIIVRSVLGDAEADSKLPFFETSDRWRRTLLKILHVVEFRSSDFPGEGEQDWMIRHGLLSNDRTSFHPNFLVEIGKNIYESLFPEEGGVRQVLHDALTVAEKNHTELHIQLEFSSQLTKRNRLPDYPWELAYHNERFLAQHIVRFSRYIAFPSPVPVPNLQSNNHLKVLVISSLAKDEENNLLPLPEEEGKTVVQILEQTKLKEYIHVDVLPRATLRELKRYLAEHQGDQAPNVLHFDGHGLYGKRCDVPGCLTIHKSPKAIRCQKCEAELSKEPEGFLLFEAEDGAPVYVTGRELGEIFQKNSYGDRSTQHGGLILAVISACKSGMALSGESIFNGIAQSLILHRIPAVVAMQYKIDVKSAIQFSEQFYLSLSHKKSLATSVSEGQTAIGSKGNGWYRPVLYLRWQDHQGGELFSNTLSLDNDILTALNLQKEKCQKQNIPFFTPNSFITLLELKKTTYRLLEELHSGLADDLQCRLYNYINKLMKNPRYVFVDFDWDTRPEIRQAQHLAIQDGYSQIKEKHLLLGFLTTLSGTQKSLRKKLGNHEFQSLIEKAKTTSAESENVIKTPEDPFISCPEVYP